MNRSEAERPRTTFGEKSVLAQLLAILASGLILTPPAHAASEKYTITWMIDPVTPTLGEKVFLPGDVITEAHLLPRRLLTIDGDAVRADGKIVLTKETQLTALQAHLQSACAFTFAPSDLLQRFWRGASQKFACFVDEDGDGRFESTFNVTSSQIGIPSSYGKIPSKRTPINPVSYRQIPLSEGRNLPRLLFKYSHQDKITGHAYFGICVANSTTKKEPCFDGYSGVRSDKLPKEIGAGGNLAVATAKQGSSVTLTVKSGFARMPFTAVEYVRWLFI